MKKLVFWQSMLSAFWVTCCSLPEPIDLGYGYDNETFVFPGFEPFHYSTMFTGDENYGVWYAANELGVAEHCGTHIDAPYHFDEYGRKVADIPLDRLITKAILVDATEETGNNYTYALPAEKLIEWELKNGEIPDKAVVLVKFGWSYRYQNKTAYLGPSEGVMACPGLSAEAAHWIVNKKKIVGVGVDSYSTDMPLNLPDGAPVHVTLSKNDIYGLENVNLTAPLPPVFNLIVMPIKLVNGTGGPTRIIAY